MKKITPEMIYSEWHRVVVFAKTKKYPRRMKNFDKAQFEINSAGDKLEKPDWSYFKKFANFANRNTLVDYKIYFKALGEFYGYIKPADIANQKSLAIYKSYIEKNQTIKSNITDVYKIITKDIKFVQKYCKEHNILSLNEYLQENVSLFPTILMHYSKGNISPYFLACIKDFTNIVQNYNQEFIDIALGNLLDNFYEYENLINKNSKLKLLKLRFKKIIK